RDDATRAVTEQEDRKPGFGSLGSLDRHRNVADIVRERLHIETFAVGLAPAPQIDGVDREIAAHQLLGHPYVVAAVRVEPVYEDHDASRRAGWAPCPGENSKSAGSIEVFLLHDCVSSVAGGGTNRR